jgi:hypothetical protein
MDRLHMVSRQSQSEALKKSAEVLIPSSRLRVKELGLVKVIRARVIVPLHEGAPDQG